MGAPTYICATLIRLSRLERDRETQREIEREGGRKHEVGSGCG